MSGDHPQIIEWLLERSFGGRQAVAVPGLPAAELRGPFPAGVHDLLRHLERSYSGPGAPSADQWAFLVGAPGNGKSEALRAIADALGISQPAPAYGARAPREIRSEVHGAVVRLVNDASIPRDDRPAEGSLHRDVAEAFEVAASQQPILFLANVNRGVLVEEIASATDVGQFAGLARECLTWLVEAASGEDAGDPATAYYARREFEASDRGVVVHVLSLDAASLFEPQPGQGKCLDFSGGDNPVVAPYAPVGMLRAARALRDSSVAGSLVADVASPDRWSGVGCSSCTAATLCPFEANARWLREPTLRVSFLETCRAAEVAAARRVTYRDLTGLVAKAILGGPADWGDEHPCAWVGELAGEGTPAAVATLASHRIYASIFPAPDASGTAWKRRGMGRIASGDLYGVIMERFGTAQVAKRAGDFDRAFRTLDPAASAAGWEGAREHVLEAVEAMHVESPVRRLVEVGALPSAAVSELDLALDVEVITALGGDTATAPRARREREPQVRRWRAALAFRHVGLAGGWFCDHAAVEGWLVAQQAALSGGDPGDLLAGLRRLLVPSTGVLRLAPFRPRTRSYDGPLPPETLFASKQANELQAELRAVKDSLQFVLRVSSDAAGHAAPVPVDLDLAREAMLLGSGGNGFTDLPDQAVARVERVLASLLSRNRLGRSRLSLQVSDHDSRLHAVRQAGADYVLVPAQAGR